MQIVEIKVKKIKDKYCKNRCLLTAKEAPQGRFNHFGALLICGTICFSTFGTVWVGATLSNPLNESAICQ